MRLLGIDTAGPVVGVGAADGPRVAVRTARIARGTEAVLPGFVTEVLAELGLRPGDLDGVVVCEGPGAFTGLRVGIAAATALATAWGLRIVGVDSLTARVGSGGPALALLDARKGRVYAALWDADGHRTHGPADVAPEVAIGWTSPGFRAVGEGALVYRALVEAGGGAVPADAADPGIARLLAEGARGFAAGEGRDPGELVPRYVRAPDVGA